MKKIIEEELENYKEYLDKYFPYSDLNKKINTEKFEVSFEKILSLSKLCHYLSSDYKIGEYASLIEYNLNNLLYFLPLNETISINMSVRNSAEYIIKLMFYFQNTNKKYHNTGYRELKDTINTLSVYSTNKSKVDTLFSIYAERSNNIHLKSISPDDLFSILEIKMTNSYEDKDLVSIGRDVNNCMLLLLEVICHYNVSLSTSQKLMIEKVVTRKWKEKIFNIK
ncbi:hypothetical protein JZO72_00790 [Vagococcus fluvialis]|uniref:hypothetical protein n=1 Tax=Vagococcus fluvialis TaxID=2738 RepID=UPI001A8D949B|nr:hypothetical protein [Vagococcus fluvialis]MBO0478150.1 hypothetical protein [Vagococcus fluvialis]MBO0483639.1 hypothetical protein [Vagococcus fluvialis]